MSKWEYNEGEEERGGGWYNRLSKRRRKIRVGMRRILGKGKE